MGYVGQAPAVAGVTSADITDGAIVNADVNASAAVDYSKLAALSDGNILVGNGSNVAVSVNPSGDVDVSNAGVFSIASDSVVNADIKSDAAIAISKLATITLATNTSGDYVQNITAGTGLTSTGATSGENIAHSLSVDASHTGITSVYNASLKMGRDSQNLIDFATTDNKIILRVNDVDEVELVENALSPVTASGVDLGTTSLEWGNIYVGDDKKLQFGDGQDATIEYDEDGTDQLRIVGNTVFENQIEATLDIEIDSTPADETVSGVTATFTAGETLVRGEVCYFKASDSKMWKAVATAAATSRCVAMAAADISADAAGLFLLQGFLADNGSFPSYTIGGAIYTPEAETSSENVPEQTAPDSDGDFVQVLGWAMTANSVYFNPSNDIIEHA
jgi:hypothetical protein